MLGLLTVTNWDILKAEIIKYSLQNIVLRFKNKGGQAWGRVSVHTEEGRVQLQ